MSSAGRGDAFARVEKCCDGGLRVERCEAVNGSRGVERQCDGAALGER